MAARHRRVWTGIVVLIALFLVAQIVPFGEHPGNPPITAEPQWDSPATRALAQQACFDCHSNETVWPGYARIAPVSWLVEHDVREGRSKLNFSEWQRPQEEADEAAEVVREGEMPPWSYTFMHADAKLGEANRAALARGLAATIGQGRDEPAAERREPAERDRR